MKHFSKFMIGALALGLWSCSSDEPLAGGGEFDGTTGDFNATLTLQLPTAGGTRSNTTDDGDPAASNSGIEVGQIYENNVDEVLVVLAAQSESNTNEFTYVTHSISKAAILKDEAQPTYALQFDSEALGDEFGNTLYVFTYCNPTTAIVNYFENGTVNPTNWIDEVAAITTIDGESNEVWKKNSFLMTNAKLAETTIRDKADQTKNQFFESHYTPATAFNLGTITVERVAARFDFQQKNAEGTTPANTYTVIDNRNDAPVATVTFTDMALFNVAKSTYYIPRVSNDGFPNGAGFTICGNETSTNWVVGPYATSFPTAAPAPANTNVYESLYGNYLYQLNGLTTYEGSTGLNWTSLSDWANKTPDNHDNWTDHTGTDYRIWCYATENVMPGTFNQRQGTTTGVMFKAQLNYIPETAEGANGEQAKVLRESMQKKHKLYAIGGVIYGDVANVALYAHVHPNSEVARAYKNSGMAAMEGNKDENLFKKVDIDTTTGEYQIVGTGVDCSTEEATAAGFTVYAPDANGNYFMYYPYFNRHNSIGNNNDGMTTMEYQVVRNNVYKLRVNSVLNFGYADRGYNPDEPGNGHEDETKKVLFRVSVKVLPWVVRLNDIDF